jgi:thiopurine S-methyltransferase
MKKQLIDWEAKYAEDRTGWDLAGSHPHLTDLLALAKGHLPTHFQVGEKEPKRLLVPGCGLGHASSFFAKLGFSVLSIDLSSTAIQKATVQYGGPSCKFVAGDFFSDQHSSSLPLSGFDIIYDRAMYCALDVAERARYFKKCSELLSILFREIDSDLVENGPPFEADFATLLDNAENLDMSLIFRQDLKGCGHRSILSESLVGFLK